jgi:hypothetical protein
MSALRRRGALPCVIPLIDDCAMQYVSSRRQIQVICGIRFEAEGLEGRKLVNCRNDRLLLEGLNGNIVGGGTGDDWGDGCLRDSRGRYRAGEWYG